MAKASRWNEQCRRLKDSGYGSGDGRPTIPEGLPLKPRLHFLNTYERAIRAAKLCWYLDQRCVEPERARNEARHDRQPAN
jgi:hypothetical protein